RGERERLCRVALGSREAGFADADSRTSAGADGGAARLVDDPRHCLAVRSRRRGPPRIADATGGTAGGCRSHLPARAGAECQGGAAAVNSATFSLRSAARPLGLPI